MRKLTVLIGVCAASLLAVAPANAATVVVQPTNLDGWAPATSGPNATVEFVAGPETPPAGIGSARLATGDGEAGGDEAAQLTTGQYAGTPLGDLTALAYSTYVAENNGQQAPYLILSIDNTGDGVEDDLLFFEPSYQTEVSRPDIVDQGDVVLDEWQRWNALVGGWWSADGVAGATPGTGVKTLGEYLEAEPDATIVNRPDGSGGVRIVVGFASATDVFESYVDAFTIGVDAFPETVTYDFEPAATPVQPPAQTGDCRGVQARLLVGSEGPDVLVGDATADLIQGLGGDDALAGVGGDDCVNGGAGEDLADGGPGNDRVDGGDDNDRVRGASGRDRLLGGDGSDRLNGGEGSDRLKGGDGGDRIRGSAAKDRLKGNAGGDRINAVDEKRDRVNCGPGQDRAKVDEEDKVSGNCERVRTRD